MPNLIRCSHNSLSIVARGRFEWLPWPIRPQ